MQCSALYVTRAFVNFRVYLFCSRRNIQISNIDQSMKVRIKLAEQRTAVGLSFWSRRRPDVGLFCSTKQLTTRSPLPSTSLKRYLGTLTTSYSNQVKMTSAKHFERLPTSVLPVNYEITIKPDLVNLVFEGNETVTLKVSLICTWLFLLTFNSYVVVWSIIRLKLCFLIHLSNDIRSDFTTN